MGTPPLFRRLDEPCPQAGRSAAQDLAASLDTIRTTYLEVAGTSRHQRRLARRMAELAALLQSSPEGMDLASLVMEADLLLGDIQTSLGRTGR